MEPFEKVERSKKSIIVNNFLGGIAWGLGATIGLTALLALIGFAVSRVDWVPVLGNVVSTGFEQAIQNQLR